MKIIAIGGGKKDKAIGRALDLTDNANVLLIPSACSTEKSYDRKVALLVQYFEQFGVPDVQVLHDFGETPSETKISHMLGSTSMAYVIGGNTPYMMQTMKSHGTDKAVSEAVRAGLVIAGTSAGAILPFKIGQSNPAAKPAEIQWDFEYIPGLSIVNSAIGVHANKIDPVLGGFKDENRRQYFTQNVLDNADRGIAVDEGAAVIIDEDKLEVVSNSDEQVILVTKITPKGEPLYDGDTTPLIVAR